MDDAVLDASAVLAFLNDETGARIVGEALPGAVISAVNLSEVVGKLNDAGMQDHEVNEVIRALGVETVPFDEDQAIQSGLLRSATQSAGLSMGDRACLNLARQLGLPAVTADRSWNGLKVGVEVRFIR